MALTDIALENAPRRPRMAAPPFTEANVAVATDSIRANRRRCSPIHEPAHQRPLVRYTKEGLLSIRKQPPEPPWHHRSLYEFTA
jgi:hypothetical protein